MCAWGDSGAAAADANGTKYTSAAFPPAGGVVDTLGAGDTFNGAVISVLAGGGDLGAAVDVGCRVAGAKVGQRGFQGLGEIFREMNKH